MSYMLPFVQDHLTNSYYSHFILCDIVQSTKVWLIYSNDVWTKFWEIFVFTPVYQKFGTSKNHENLGPFIYPQTFERWILA